MELKQTDAILLKLLYAVAAGIVITQALGLDNVTSILFLLTFPLTVVLWGRSIRRKLDSTDMLVLLTAVLAVVSVLLNALITETTISFNYIKKLIIFIMSLLFLSMANRMRVERSFIRYVNAIVDSLTVFLIAMYFIAGPRMYMINGWVTKYLTFGFSNPNLTGLFLVCLYMLTVYRLFSREKVAIKLIHIAMAAFLAWFVLETRSRNCLLIMMLYTAICAWLIFRGRKKMRIGKGMSVTIAVFPAIFVLLYMALISAEWVKKVFSILIEEGKLLDSRTVVWTKAMEFVVRSPILGAYSELSDGTGMFQMHNSHLDVMASYGIPAMFLVCVLLQKCLHQKGRVYQEKHAYLYILGFACAIMLGIGEAALFSGGMGIYIFVGAFLLLTDSVETQSVRG